MTKKIDTQDSAELEDLFSSIVAGKRAMAAAPATQKSNESAHKKNPTKKSKAVESSDEKPEAKVINSIGHMTRALHDSLRELGHDKGLEKAASSIPDAQNRLAYVATLTQQAAEKVLNATDAIQPVIESISKTAASLDAKWDALMSGKLGVDEFKAIALETHAFIKSTPRQMKEANGDLMNIVMAQDFQDLTGQIIKKIIAVTQQMEVNLVDLLRDNIPSIASPDVYASLGDGPVVNAEGRTDIVTGQDQVDDLLASLGF